ncbi:auxin-responsive protein IAA9-like [Phragmites australis]|uniref:auxin-responsive protein IAA9-like n=1 Tax=Phragmites australis TaxID=29695 RepID=UPI002D768357|nr:auxin-responsive protein IAA9-like [Phragmites australis]
MELELGLAPPNAHLMINHLGKLSCSSDSSSEKRGFREAFQATTATLPLFDDGSSKKKKQLVGWPPVSSARSRACGGANYVKVKKEGDAIGRKVDLSLHASYGELLVTLGRMFPAANSQEEKEISSSTRPVVTYEDGEGDWMLVGDVPWDDFLRSVKRLKILG